MIDCDIHVQLGDPEDVLAYVDPAQRDWFRAQGPMLGLPGYPWSHPVSFFRQDLRPGPNGLPGTSVEDVRREVLDPYGTSIGILNADDFVTLSLMPSPYRALELARAHNDWLRERWHGDDPRLRGSILCPAQDPLAAAREIERCAADPWFVHVLLVGGSERPYGEPRYLPIFEAAAAAGLPVCIHTGGEGMGIAAPGGGAGPATFYLEWHTLGSAGSQMAHLVSLLANGTFERVPGLRVLLVEGGIAWLPGILWRLETNWRGLRAEVPWLDRAPGEVVREHVRFTTQPLEHTNGHDALLWEMLVAVGAPEILCFASDYPHWDGDDPGVLVDRLPQHWREPVIDGNARAFYGERLSAFAPA